MTARDDDTARTHRDENAGSPGLAVENAELSQSRESVSDFGELDAKRRAVAAEAGGSYESGSVATQRAYEARDAQVTDEERAPRRRGGHPYHTERPAPERPMKPREAWGHGE